MKNKKWIVFAAIWCLLSKSCDGQKDGLLQFEALPVELTSLRLGMLGYWVL